MNIRKWLIRKLAGDRLVVLNAAILYKYYPIFADITKDPIIEDNALIKLDTDTPFNVYARHIFESKKDGGMDIDEKYKDAYKKVIEEITEKQKEKQLELDLPEPDEEGTST